MACRYGTFSAGNDFWSTNSKYDLSIGVATYFESFIEKRLSTSSVYSD